MIHRNSPAKSFKDKKRASGEDSISSIDSGELYLLSPRKLRGVHARGSLEFTVRYTVYVKGSIIRTLSGSGITNSPVETTPRPKLYTLGVIDIRCCAVPISPTSEESEGNVESGVGSVGNFPHSNHPDWLYLTIRT